MRSGETLASIAGGLWGDAGLWYKIAQANGLTGIDANSALAAGSTLTIPNIVTNVHNNSGTFQVYDPAQALGDTRPDAIAPPIDDGGQCAVIGQILIVAVTVAVTSALAGPLGNIVGSQVIGGALAGAAGSIAGQGFGVATGLQEKFSFKQVGLAAIAGGVSGGLSELTRPGNLLGGAGAFARAASDAARGVIASVASQGIGVATGLQDRFSWSSVAAAGIGAAAGGYAGSRIGGTGLPAEIGRSLASGTADAIAQAATRTALSGASFGDNLLASMPSVIGNTVGQTISMQISGGSASAYAADRRAIIEGKAFARDFTIANKIFEADMQASGTVDINLADGASDFMADWTAEWRRMERVADMQIAALSDELGVRIDGPATLAGILPERIARLAPAGAGLTELGASHFTLESGNRYGTSADGAGRLTDYVFDAATAYETGAFISGWRGLFDPTNLNTRIASQLLSEVGGDDVLRKGVAALLLYSRNADGYEIGNIVAPEVDHFNSQLGLPQLELASDPTGFGMLDRYPLFTDRDISRVRLSMAADAYRDFQTHMSGYENHSSEWFRRRGAQLRREATDAGFVRSAFAFANRGTARDIRQEQYAANVARENTRLGMALGAGPALGSLPTTIGGSLITAYGVGQLGYNSYQNGTVPSSFDIAMVLPGAKPVRAIDEVVDVGRAASGLYGSRDVATDGIVYLRVDRSGNLADYVGRTTEANRIAREAAHNRAHPNSRFEFFEIESGILRGRQLDIAEHNAIQEITDGVAARHSSAVSNQRDPVGPLRRPEFGLPEPR
ncbi:LysM peptidoglycan-binding domain-containing protein [uncultured Parasphingopyxis sp.]|uniref:LysM peptidoglycan-binding domain-containing protein n=1 Tax=uncultured Parasphingopyxis sp. TaxID=1547918 RepID=UPI0026309F23|nr:LysM peptidoglycan-binding domain-containing protein [uncultured Parasphingopyxis sp.]